MIEKLLCMPPEEAATKVGTDCFLNLVSEGYKDNLLWTEIRDNIRKSGKGLVGSGFGFTLLHAFAEKGDEFAIQLLFAKGADIEAKTKRDETALMLAIECERMETVQLLITKGSDVNTMDKDGHGPLIMAVKSAQTRIVQLLLENGAILDHKSIDGYTALTYAKAIPSSSKDKTIIRRLLLDAARAQKPRWYRRLRISKVLKT
jgi:ankyrin repeat protein